MKIKEIATNIDNFCMFWAKNRQNIILAFGELDTANIQQIIAMIGAFKK